jgi:sulfate adenylyltransferase
MNYGGYIEIHVSTSREVCEQRDAKGLYKLARKGVIKEFTGISDPYEAPENPDIIIDSGVDDPEVLVEEILLKIEQLGYL